MAKVEAEVSRIQRMGRGDDKLLGLHPLFRSTPIKILRSLRMLLVRRRVQWKVLVICSALVYSQAPVATVTWPWVNLTI